MMEIAENGVIVGLVVRDAEAVLDFYQNILEMKLAGSEPMDEGGTKYYLSFPGGYVKLFAPDRRPEIRPQRDLAQTGYNVLTFLVSSLKESCKVFEEKGVRFVSALQTTDTGTHWTIIADPEGNYIELAETG